MLRPQMPVCSVGAARLSGASGCEGHKRSSGAGKVLRLGHLVTEPVRQARGEVVRNGPERGGDQPEQMRPTWGDETGDRDRSPGLLDPLAVAPGVEEDCHTTG